MHIVTVLTASVLLAFAINRLEKLLTDSLFRPIALNIVGSGSELSDLVLHKKVPAYISTMFFHSIQWVFWLRWAFVHATWFTKLGSWDQHLQVYAPPKESSERDSIAPLYIMYFGYCLNSCWKDLNKKGKAGGFLGFLFKLHHLIAVVLTSMSIHYGHWRAGFLTRLTHDPGDIVLYACLVYKARVTQGNGRRPVLLALYLLNFVSWFGSRVGLYGWLVVALTVMWKRTVLPIPVWTYEQLLAASVLLVGSMLMWLLQAIWGAGLVASCISFLKEGRGKDYFHEDKKSSCEDKKSSCLPCGGSKKKD